MEPMALGSPNSSPAAGGNSPFLPSFLTGETDITTTPRSNTLSPTKRRTLSFATSPGTNVQSPPDFNVSLSIGQKALFGQQQQQQQQQNASFHSTSMQNLNASVTGPPTQGLFDSLREEMNQVQTPKKSVLHQTQNQSCIGPASGSTSIYNQSFNDSYLNQSNFNASRLTSPVANYNSTGATNPIPRNNNSQFENNVTTNNLTNSTTKQKYANFWITVFGFPQNATTMILSHFSQCGAIIEKVFPSQYGNWVHLRYSSRLECDKALNYNEKILGNNIMIGVIKCKDPSIIDKENLNDNSQFFKVRPLSQVAYNSKQCESAVVTCPPVPQKSSGIVNKAMDLLFGW